MIPTQSGRAWELFSLEYPCGLVQQERNNAEMYTHKRKKKKPGNALIHLYPQNMFQQEDLRKKSSCLQQFTVNTTFSPPAIGTALVINSVVSQLIMVRQRRF